MDGGHILWTNGEPPMISNLFDVSVETKLNEGK